MLCGMANSRIHGPLSQPLLGQLAGYHQQRPPCLQQRAQSTKGQLRLPLVTFTLCNKMPILPSIRRFARTRRTPAMSSISHFCSDQQNAGFPSQDGQPAFYIVLSRQERHICLPVNFARPTECKLSSAIQMVIACLPKVWSQRQLSFPSLFLLKPRECQLPPAARMDSLPSIFGQTASLGCHHSLLLN